MNEVEAVKAAIANTTDFDGDRMASRYADSELHAVALAAIAAVYAPLVEALSDNGELLTIAWMDGSHRSNTAHRARIAELEAEVERLREALGWYAKQFCELGTSHECCGRMTADDCSGCLARAILEKQHDAGA